MSHLVEDWWPHLGDVTPDFGNIRQLHSLGDRWQAFVISRPGPNFTRHDYLYRINPSWGQSWFMRTSSASRLRTIRTSAVSRASSVISWAGTFFSITSNRILFLSIFSVNFLGLQYLHHKIFRKVQNMTSSMLMNQKGKNLIWANRQQMNRFFKLDSPFTFSSSIKLKRLITHL